MPSKSSKRYSLTKPPERRSSMTVASVLGLPQGAGGQSRSTKSSSSAVRGRGEIESLYEKLRQMDKSVPGEVIGPAGLVQLFKELSIAPDTVEMFTLLWRLGATKNGTVSHGEWLACMYTYGVDSTSQLRAKLQDWIAEVRTKPSSFTAMYNFVYDFVRGENYRQMVSSVAVKAWEVFFKDVPLFALWKEWLPTYEGDISRDIWKQLPVFFSTVKKVEDYDTTARWSCIFDDFVEWWQKKKV